uniref:HATPase_c domain-containing protein n=1 Tax=Caenorhabditis tropicalis TaxID=1561998 RepID=A0A1I7T2U7_9PELO
MISHNHPFSAIFEIVDHSYDANAKNLKIDFIDGTARLIFSDDGYGMNRSSSKFWTLNENSGSNWTIRKWLEVRSRSFDDNQKR